MSHFTVGVFIKDGGKNLEELLAPYQQNNMGDCPKEYLAFEDCTEEVLATYEKHKEEYKDIDTFAAKYHGYEKDEETGKYGYWENPNAEWDWYEIGGRWSNKILTRNGERCNSAKLKDIDWETMNINLRKKAEKVWDSNPQGAFRYLMYGIEKDDTKETYIERESRFETYAVITPDGEWHSKGKMGWFGFSSETMEYSEEWGKSFYDAFIKDKDKELTLVIVDCHI